MSFPWFPSWRRLSFWLIFCAFLYVFSLLHVSACRLKGARSPDCSSCLSKLLSKSWTAILGRLESRFCQKTIDNYCKNTFNRLSWCNAPSCAALSLPLPTKRSQRTDRRLWALDESPSFCSWGRPPGALGAHELKDLRGRAHSTRSDKKFWFFKRSKNKKSRYIIIPMPNSKLELQKFRELTDFSARGSVVLDPPRVWTESPLEAQLNPQKHCNHQRHFFESSVIHFLRKNMKRNQQEVWLVFPWHLVQPQTADEINTCWPQVWMLPSSWQMAGYTSHAGFGSSKWSRSVSDSSQIGTRSKAFLQPRFLENGPLPPGSAS